MSNHTATAATIEADLLATYVAHRDHAADHRRARATMALGVDADTRQRAEGDAARAADAAYAIAVRWTDEERAGYVRWLATA